MYLSTCLSICLLTYLLIYLELPKLKYIDP